MAPTLEIEFMFGYRCLAEDQCMRSIGRAAAVRLLLYNYYDLTGYCNNNSLAQAPLPSHDAQKRSHFRAGFTGDDLLVCRPPFAGLLSRFRERAFSRPTNEGATV